MMIVKEEIFGPVGLVVKFEDEAGLFIFSNPQIYQFPDMIRQANNTLNGMVPHSAFGFRH